MQKSYIERNSSDFCFFCHLCWVHYGFMLGYWIHNLDPFLVRFPPKMVLPGIRWYGVAYFLGFIVAWWQINWYRARRGLKLSVDQQQSLLSFVFIGLVIGGRLGYALLYEGACYWHYPHKIFYFWEGGMASHGAFIGVFLSLWIFAHRYQFSLFSLGDLVVTLAPVGIFFGRIGNFINGELYGRITDVPWAVIFPTAGPVANFPIECIAPRHPSQLYEALAEGLFLFFYTQFRLWKGTDVVKFPGRLAAEFLTLYGIVRIVCEMFREPDAPLLWGFSRGQAYSIFCVFIGFILLAYIRGRKNASSASLFTNSVSKPGY